jgi:hypothetical protein
LGSIVLSPETEIVFVVSEGQLSQPPIKTVGQSVSKRKRLFQITLTTTITS